VGGIDFEVPVLSDAFEWQQALTSSQEFGFIMIRTDRTSIDYLQECEAIFKSEDLKKDIGLGRWSKKVCSADTKKFRETCHVTEDLFESDSTPACAAKQDLYNLWNIGMKDAKLVSEIICSSMKSQNTCIQTEDIMYSRDARALRIHYYEQHTENEDFLDEHVDGTSFTIVYANETDGNLEIFSDVHGWMTVHAPPGTAVVLIGVALQAISQEYVRSTLHRVKTCSIKRLSANFVVLPSLDKLC
jgi:isopenicillin N synthase-like dioxygenase